VPRTVTMAIMGHTITDMNARYDTVEDWEELEEINKLAAYGESVRQNVSLTPSTDSQETKKALKFQGLTRQALAEVHGNRTHLTAFGRHTGFEVREPHQ
jgi:hypothetical protein